MRGRTVSKKAAARHNRVRKQHSDELAEDYVEAIGALLGERGQARVTDLQGVFGVSHVSVIRALKRIEERGLVERTEAGGYELTRTGKAIAEASAERHDLVVRFLLALGVSSGQAEADAEGMEHHLSEESLRAMKAFLESQ
ncbi:MAG: iron dependent repressor, metal binding and dimerization domain protein [Puniceicoccaceae bacterium]